MAVGAGPVLRREQHRRGAVGQRRRVAGGHRGGLALAEDRLEGGELLDRGVGPEVLVALETPERRELVVEEPGVVRRGEVLVGGRGQRVLVGPRDLPLQRRQRGVLPHRQTRPRLGVLRDRQPDVPGPDLRQGGQLAHGVAGGVDLHQLLAQLVADGDGSVGGRVGAAGDADVDLAERDLVGDLDGRLEAGAAGLLDVGGGRLGREPGAEHALAGEVEVAGVLEHRTGHDLAQSLTLESESERRGRRGSR